MAASNKERIIGFKIVLNGSEKTIKEIADLELEMDKLAKQIRAAKSAGDTDLYKKLRMEQEALKEASKQLRGELADQKKEFEKTKFATGSYKQLDAQLGALRKRFRELSDAEREGKIGQALLGDIRQLDVKLKGIDAQLGNFQRNVGNYGNSLRGLFKGLQSQLNATALFGRIGNLPALFGTIQGTIETVTKAVGDFIDGWNKMYDASAVVQKEFKAQQEETIKMYAEQRTELDGLLMVANDKTKSDAEQNAALAELNDLYKQYLPNLSEEELSLTDINELKGQVNDAIIKEIALKQQAVVFEKLRNETLQIGQALEQARRDDANSSIFAFANLSGVLEGMYETSKKALVESKTLSEDFEKVLKDVQKFAEESGIENFWGAAYDPGKVKDNAAKTQEELAKAAEKAAEEARKAQELLIKIQIEFGKESAKVFANTAKTLEAQRIAAIQNERDQRIASEMSSLEAFKASQKQELDAYIATQQEKINQAKDAKGISNAEAMKLESQLQADIVKLQKDTDAIIKNEITASNERIATINKEFAMQQAEARAQIQSDAMAAAIAAQENSVARREAGRQTIEIGFQFDEQSAQQEFAKAKAELDLQLAQGNITQQEYANQLQAATVKRLEEEAAIAQKRLDIEKQLGAEIVAQTQTLNNARLQGALSEIEAEKQARLASLEDQLKQGLIAQQEFEAARLNVIESSEQQVKSTRAETEEANAALAQEFNNKIVADSKEVAQKQLEIEIEKATAIEEQQVKQSEKLKEYAQFAADTINQAFDLVNQFIQQSLDQQIEKINQRYDREAVLAFGNAEKIKAIEEKRAKDLDRVNKRAAALRKAQAITQAIINGALGVTNILANLIDPTPIQAFKAVQLGIVGGITAAQIAVIAAQKFAQGGSLYELYSEGGEMAPSDLAPMPQIGMVHGKSHAQGGEKFLLPGGRIAELEGGEMVDITEKGRMVVINKRSASTFRTQLQRSQGQVFQGKDDMLSRINAFAGMGKRFAQGGAITPLPAPVVELGKSNADVEELKQQNLLLQESNARILQLIESTQNMVINSKVIADPKEIAMLGNEEIKKAQTKTLGG